MLSTSITMTEADDVSVEKNSSDEFRIKDLGISTAKIADLNVTQEKMSSVNIVSSASCGVFNSNDMTSSWKVVTNLNVTINSNGRPIMVLFNPDGSGNASKIEGYAGGGFTTLIRILRNGTEVYQSQIQGNDTGVTVNTYEAGALSLMHLETGLGAGSYNYTVEVKSLSNTNTWVKYFKLVAYELP